MPASIEKSVWTYFSDQAEERGIELSELLTEVLKRDIEIGEALKQEKLPDRGDPVFYLYSP